jgi:hypothetical protein
MRRTIGLRLWLAALAPALLAVGCAHCDKCNELPAPCAGDCLGSYTPAGGPGPLIGGAPVVVSEPIPGGLAPIEGMAPAATGTPGPFQPQGGTRGGTGATPPSSPPGREGAAGTTR